MFKTLWLTILLTCLMCAAVCTQGGCAAHHAWSDRPVAVRVIDAETGRPLGGASITLHYGSDPSKSAHPNITRNTDPNGDAFVFTGASTASAGATSPPEWRIQAPGYIGYWIDGQPGRRVPDGVRGDSADEPYLIRLYSQPAPSVTIVVGDRFRGPLTVHLAPPLPASPAAPATPGDEWIQDGVAGRREFIFSPDADRHVEIVAAPLLARELCRPLGFCAIHFRNREGRELLSDWAVYPALASSRAAPEVVCARLIYRDPKSENGRWRETFDLYVIGTAADARAAAQRKTEPP